MYVVKARDPETVDIPDLPLHEFVLKDCARYGDKPALIDGGSGRSYTFQELPTLVAKVAVGLTQQGLKQGDVLMLLSPNLIEFPLVVLGALTIGVAVSTCNPLYTSEEISAQLKNSNAKVVVTIPLFLEKVQAANPTIPVITIGEAHGSATVPLSRMIATADPALLPAVKVSPDDIAILPYSSGTTGMPKGVILTHRNIVANIVQVCSSGRANISDQDVLLGLLPMFHIYGISCIMFSGITTGASIVFMPKFDLAEMLALIALYRISVVHVAPPILLALAKHPIVDKYDMSSLTRIISGAAPMAKDLADAVVKRLKVVVAQGYGMTECSPVATLTTDIASPPKPCKLGSIGTVLPNMEIKIVSVQTGKDLAHNEHGELCIRGPNVMKGYLNDLEATKVTIDSQGWLHTGDLGYIDQDEEVFIVDRVKELIKYKGYQVPPAELEALLVAHPSIADAAVVPQKDTEAGEVPVGFVVKAPNTDITEEAVMEYCAQRVAPYKKLRRVVFVDAIPKAASGKILRRELRARLQQTQVETETKTENKTETKSETDILLALRTAVGSNSSS
eukprot:jgi/Chlat1/2577/Chrsp175S02417